MADIFNEVDEELRRERLKQAWERYGGLIIGLALIVIIGVGGWRGYQWYEAKKAAQAGAEFEQAVTHASEGRNDEAEAAFARIAAQGTAYQTLAKFRQAAEVSRRDRPAAVAIYDSLVTDAQTGVALQDLARIRGGLLLVDTASFDDMRMRLAPATGGDRVFRHSARELMAFAAWRANNVGALKQWFDAMVADRETPIGVRTRAEMLMALSTPEAGS